MNRLGPGPVLLLASEGHHRAHAVQALLSGLQENAVDAPEAFTVKVHQFWLRHVALI